MGQRGGCGHKRRPPCLTIEIVKEKFTDFNSPTMYLFFILSLAANLVSSQDPLCAKGNPFLELPKCTVCLCHPFIAAQTFTNGRSILVSITNRTMALVRATSKAFVTLPVVFLASLPDGVTA
jgi:hypothetical protein